MGIGLTEYADHAAVRYSRASCLPCAISTQSVGRRKTRVGVSRLGSLRWDWDVVSTRHGRHRGVNGRQARTRNAETEVVRSRRYLFRL